MRCASFIPQGRAGGTRDQAASGIIAERPRQAATKSMAADPGPAPSGRAVGAVAGTPFLEHDRGKREALGHGGPGLDIGPKEQASTIKSPEFTFSLPP